MGGQAGSVSHRIMVSRDRIRSSFKGSHEHGTHDIARAAEMLLVEGGIEYWQNPDPEHQDDVPGSLGALGTGSQSYATKLNCFDFLHLCDNLACCSDHRLRSGNNFAAFFGAGGQYKKWDGSEDIPRGSVLIITNSLLGTGPDKVYHVAVATGEGRLIGNAHETNVHEAAIKDEFSILGIQYGTVYFGPYHACPCDDHGATGHGDTAAPAAATPDLTPVEHSTTALAPPATPATAAPRQLELDADGLTPLERMEFDSWLGGLPDLDEDALPYTIGKLSQWISDDLNNPAEQIAQALADRPSDTNSLQPWQLSTGGALKLAQLKAAHREEARRADARSKDKDLDTGHYDDGRAFGWKRDEPPTPADPNLDTGHYDDGHAFGWGPNRDPSGPVDLTPPPVTGADDPLIEQIEQGILDDKAHPRPVPRFEKPAPVFHDVSFQALPDEGVAAAPAAVGRGAAAAPPWIAFGVSWLTIPVVAAIVIVVILIVGAGGYIVAFRPAAHVGGLAAGSGAGQEQILWGDTQKLVNANGGPNCQEVFVYTIKISNGSRYAGKAAVVLLYGPGFTAADTETHTVGADGTFQVTQTGRQCFTSGSQGVALVSVGGNSNVFPKPPSVPSGSVAPPAATSGINWRIGFDVALNGQGAGVNCSYKLYVNVNWVAVADNPTTVAQTIGKTAIVKIDGPGLAEQISVPLTAQGDNLVLVATIGASTRGATYTATLISLGGQPATAAPGQTTNPCLP